MPTILNTRDLPGGATSGEFEGYLYDNVNVSFIVSETAVGKGPRLHKHAYAEVFVVLDGRLTFTVGDCTIEAVGGQIVIAPAETPHKFTNPGPGVARSVNIHDHRCLETTWLEE